MDGRTLALASLAGLAVAGVARARSEGSFIRYGSRRPPVDPTTQSPAFRAWFKESVVVDTRGRPLVVYHGTPDARGLLQEGFRTHADRACWRRGDDCDVFFASVSSRVADSYADEGRAWDFQGAEPAVIPLYLSLQDPLVVDAKGQRWRNTRHVIAEARAAGHDGVIIQDSIDYYDSPPPRTRVPTTTVYAWFDPTQAKSAMKAPLRSRVDGKPLAGSGPNAGTWDAKDPRLSANQGHPDPTGSPEFNRWFSGSLVTEDGRASGRPLRVYHGTRTHFDTFKTRRGADRLGAYFTASPEAAGKMHGGVPIVMPVYLRMLNPVDLRHVSRGLLANHLGLSKKAQWDTQVQGSAGPYSTLEYLGRTYDLVPKLKRRGHDGIIFDGQHEGDTYVVFDPRQVKSAIGNRGTYHAHDARISANREDTAITAEPSSSGASAIAIVTRGDRVLLLQRGATAPWKPLYWNLPGGGIDPGETPIHAAIRECQEEAGIALRPGSVRSLGTSMLGTWTLHFFTAESPTETVRLDYESAAHAWVRLDELARYRLVPGIARMIRRALQEPAKAGGANRDVNDDPMFARWFAGSRVRDALGAPLRVYHGTPGDPRKRGPFTRFDPKMRGGLGGVMGSWFASDAGAARWFARPRYAGVVPSVVEAYLRIENPAEFASYTAYIQAADSQARFGKSIEDNLKTLRRSLIRKGHDGFVIRGCDSDSGIKRDDWVAFDPDQVRIVGNA